MVCPDSSSVFTRNEGSLRQPGKRKAHFLLIGFCFGLNRLGNHRLWKLHSLQYNDMGWIAERIAGSDFLESDRCGDIASVNFLDFIALVGVHLHDPPQTLFLLFDGVIEGIARTDNA